jgi:predicted ATPase
MNEAATEDFPVEKLRINSFLSLHGFEFEFKQFNVITGDIASGKSLIIKALDFFENVFTGLLFLPYEDFNIDAFHENITASFMRRFHLDDKEAFDIEYSYSFKGTVFEMKIFRNEGSGDISVESDFLDKELKEWSEHIKAKKIDTPDKFDKTKDELYERLSKKFGETYPVATTFVPATRAALAIGKSDFKDFYLKDFGELISFIKKWSTSKYNDKISKILKAAIKVNGDFQLLSNDGRDVVIANASSGQQEIFYILLLLDKLPKLLYSYGKQHYIFIEEPEAHLFPLEQKLVLELVIQIFNDLKDDRKNFPAKFFITTHSPYVLNTINNSLLKGGIIKNNEEFKEQIFNDEKTKETPALDHGNVSALFIGNDGQADPILKEYRGNYLINPDKINDISRCIGDCFNALHDLNAKLLKEKKNV